MNNRIAIIMVFLMCCFLIIPPMFSEGGLFDSTYMVKDCYGEIVLMHGKYHSSSFNIILLTLLSFIFIAVPYIFIGLHKSFKWISILGGTWLMAALSYQIIGAIIPDSIFLETMKQQWTVVKFSSMFTIGIISIIIHETWSQHKSY